MNSSENASIRRNRRSNQAIDPVLAVIRSGRKLLSDYQRGGTFPDAPTHALFDHFRGALLNTAPTTPEGGIALAKYVVELSHSVGDSFEREALPVIDLISRVKLA